MTSTVKYLGELRTEATHLLSGEKIITDAPPDNQGRGEAFSPTDLCAASLGACGTTIMSLFARDKGIALEGIDFELVKEMSPAPRRIARIVVSYRLRGAFDDGEFRRIVAAGKACPVRITLGDGVEIVEDYARA